MVRTHIKRSLPRYVLAKALAGGRTAYYWSPTEVFVAKFAAIGLPLWRRALGSDFWEACIQAEQFNAECDLWAAAHPVPRKGSPRANPKLDWLKAHLMAERADA